LPPEKVQEYFKQKGYQVTWNWLDMWQKAHNHSFTVAKAMKEDILTDIRLMVDRAIDEGLTFQQFRKELEPRLQAKGWWGKQVINGEEVQLGSPYRLKTIYRTNINVGYSVGRYQEQIAQTGLSQCQQPRCGPDSALPIFLRLYVHQLANH
jgi:uncharacterized protein with gpF-like domain